MEIKQHSTRTSLQRIANTLAASFAFWWLAALVIEWFYPSAITRWFSPHWLVVGWMLLPLVRIFYDVSQNHK